MQRTLRAEFNGLHSRLWKIAAVVAIAATLAIGAAVLWPPTTLRASAERVATMMLVPPYRDGRNVWSQPMKWHWVDASRRAELLGTEDGNAEFVDAALRLAAGRPFLAMMLPRQAFVATRSGPVLVFEIFSGNPPALARDARGGPLLDLAPYKLTPRVAAVPLDTLMDVVTPEPGREKDVAWRTFLTRPANKLNLDDRFAISIWDPLVALRFGREARP